jgi:hypothetical protein
MLNAVGLYATTVGALLIYLHLRQLPQVQLQSTEEKTAYESHQRRLRIGVGLLAAWLLIQDIAVLML